MGKRLAIQLQILSPVHIGTGEDYEPTGFVVNEKNRELIAFDSFSFIRSLEANELRRFSDICKQGTIQSLLDIYKFVHGYQDKVDGTHVALAVGFIEHYRKTLKLSSTDIRKLRNEMNRFRIERTASQPVSGLPYIPGSAIKGAIRTAILNHRSFYRSFQGKNAANDMEKSFLKGSFDTDPMRLIKVSDFLSGEKCATRIVYAVNRKKKMSKHNASGPYQILETIGHGSLFYGTINIDSPHPESGIRNPIKKAELIQALSSFFGREMEREQVKMNGIGIQFGMEMGQNSYPIRIGRHSGAESVTVEGHRSIKIMQGRGKDPKDLDHATTFWFAADTAKPATNDNLKPFGWTCLQEISSAEWEDFKANEHQRLKKVHKAVKQKTAERKKAQEKEAAERKRQEAIEKEQKAQQDAKKTKEKELKERWQAMSEEERDLAIIRGDEIAQSNAPGVDVLRDIWPKIDGADPDHQKALALALKDRWQLKESRWTKKQCSKKQWAKVKKIKEILGES